ncbi:MAG: hypothetical protein Tsb0020_32440 [Haliangiales bacterium]
MVVRDERLEPLVKCRATVDLHVLLGEFHHIEPEPWSLTRIKHIEKRAREIIPQRKWSDPFGLGKRVSPHPGANHHSGAAWRPP